MKGEKMKKLFKGLLPLVTILFVLSSCNLMESDDTKQTSSPVITGTWISSDSSTDYTKYTITDSKVSIYFSDDSGETFILGDNAEIINIHYNKLNAESSTEGLNSYGYMTIKYSEGTYSGNYAVIRWMGLTTEAAFVSFGGNGVSTFTTEADAENGMDSSYFTSYESFTLFNDIVGTWTNTYGDVSFTETYYDGGYSSGTIDSIHYNTLNADSTTTDTSGYGYMVILYDAGSGDGKYGVLRWKDLTSDSVNYSEGYGDGTYYDTAAEAEAGMDNTYFTWYSDLARK